MRAAAWMRKKQQRLLLDSAADEQSLVVFVLRCTQQLNIYSTQLLRPAGGNTRREDECVEPPGTTTSRSAQTWAKAAQIWPLPTPPLPPPPDPKATVIRLCCARHQRSSPGP